MATSTDCLAGTTEYAATPSAVFRASPTASLAAASGHPVEEMTRDEPEHRWRSTSAAAADTCFDVTLGRRVPIGALQIAGNLSTEALIRLTIDPDWRHRHYVDAVDLESSSSITTPSSFTFMAWLRITEWQGATTAIAFLGDPSLVAAETDWVLHITTAGVLQVNFNRHQASPVFLVGDIRVDDCDWFQVALTFDDSTNDLTLYQGSRSSELAFVVDNQDTRALTPETDDVLGFSTTSGVKLEVGGQVALFGRALSLSELKAAFSDSAAVRRGGPELLWELDEGTGTTATDSSGNGHGGTLDSASWGTFRNPRPAWTEIVERYGKPRRRPSLDLDAADNLRTSAEISNTHSFAVEFTVDIPGILPSATEILASMGTGTTSSLYEWRINRKTDGTIDANVPRYSGSTHLISGLAAAAGRHRIMLSVDGTTDKATVYIDGVAGTPSDTGVYLSKTGSERLALGSWPTGVSTSGARCRFQGDLIVWDFAATPSDGTDYSRMAPDDDPRIKHHYTLDEDSTTHVDRGYAGSNLSRSGGTREIGVIKDDPTAKVAAGMPGASIGSLARAPSTPISASGALFEIYDPDNASGWIELAKVGVWEDARFPNSQINMPTQHSSLKVSPSGYESREAGTASTSVNVTVPFADADQAAKLLEGVHGSQIYGERLLMIAGYTESWEMCLANRLVAWGLARPAQPSFQHLLASGKTVGGTFVVVDTPVR